MALLHTQFFSGVLGTCCSMDVILPEASQGIGVAGQAEGNQEAPLPVLYLLHGLSDDHTIWQRRTSIERYVSNRRLAVIMPTVNRSFYTDEKYGYRYWTFISEELPQIVRHLFKISSRREDTFAAGLSMGGYGALKLGLRCPDRYAAAASLSGAVDLTQFIETPDPDSAAECRMIFGSLAEYIGSDNDLFALAKKTADSGCQKPDLFMACGTDDFLYQDNLRMKPCLEQLGYNLLWSQKPGAVHEWGYWDEMIQKVLDWLPLNQ
ncbi:MAG: alpha/beta hydrolase family protein [Clostridiaceae bacterium]|nr:alpha/beta hydrolase family protein [Clostridiaceae bacterium]